MTSPPVGRKAIPSSAQEELGLGRDSERSAAHPQPSRPRVRLRRGLLVPEYRSWSGREVVVPRQARWSSPQERSPDRLETSSGVGRSGQGRTESATRAESRHPTTADCVVAADDAPPSVIRDVQHRIDDWFETTQRVVAGLLSWEASSTHSCATGRNPAASTTRNPTEPSGAHPSSLAARLASTTA